MADMTAQSIVPTLHHLASSQSFRVLFALEELSEAHGTQYKLEKYARSTQGPVPSMNGIFPLGKSPILTIEENEAPSKSVIGHPKYPGVLTESRLILQYLSDTFAKGIWDPEDETDKKQDSFMQEFGNSTLGAKTDFILIFELIPPHLPPGLRQLVGLVIKPVVSHFMKDLQPIYQLLEDTLTDERPWFSGRKIGLADFNISWSMDKSSQRKYLDKEKYPKLAAWCQKITKRPAYQRALEKGGAYDLVRFL